MGAGGRGGAGVHPRGRTQGVWAECGQQVFPSARVDVGQRRKVQCGVRIKASC